MTNTRVQVFRYVDIYFRRTAELHPPDGNESEFYQMRNWPGLVELFVVNLDEMTLN